MYVGCCSLLQRPIYMAKRNWPDHHNLWGWFVQLVQVSILLHYLMVYQLFCAGLHFKDGFGRFRTMQILAQIFFN